VNEKWTDPIFDIEIEVILDDNLVMSDLKTSPCANSFQNKKVLWKVSPPPRIPPPQQ